MDARTRASTSIAQAKTDLDRALLEIDLIQTYDPAVFAGVAALLGLIALIAALIPAHRATRVNPLDAVRGM